MVACIRLTGWPVARNWRRAVLSADAGLLVLTVKGIKTEQQFSLPQSTDFSSVMVKFHYAVLVALAGRSEAGRRPAASWNLAYHALSSSLAAS